MRDDRTKATWSVDIPSFELFKFPVTQELYQAIRGEQPSSFIGDQSLASGEKKIKNHKWYIVNRKSNLKCADMLFEIGRGCRGLGGLGADFKGNLYSYCKVRVAWADQSS